ncbi:APC family permease [Saccharopolyspora shandongensis]|uniref:APC family permease n=1 Tax=Saccharopolyspora shandongensis TaxID=418495 RepID=UPI00343DD2E1
MTDLSKPLAPPDPVPGTLRARHVVFFVIAAAAPLGFAVGSVPLAIGRGGVGTALMFFVVGAFLMLFAVGYVTMARFVPNAGALFSFITAGLGRPLGLGTAFVAALAYAVASAGSVGPFAVFGSYATESVFGFTTSWQTWAFAGAALMGLLGLLNVELNLRVLGVIMLVEVAALTVLGVGIIAQGGAPGEGLSLDALRPDAVSGSGLGVVLLVVFAAFAGFEATALFREEARDPVTTVRRATFASLAVIAVFQGFVAWAIVQAYGRSAVQVANEQPTTMFTLAADRFVGSWLADAITLLVVGSWFASLLAFHNATTRYLAVLARDGALPSALSRRSRRTGAPWVASLSHTVFTFAVIGYCAAQGLDPYLDLFVVGSVPVAVSIPAMECLTAIAIIAFFYRDRRGQSRWAVLVAPAVSAVALALVVYAVVANIALFTAREGAINIVLPSINLVILVLGIGRALWMRRKHPDQYERLGHWGSR